MKQLALAIAIAAALVACGKKDESSTTASTAPVTTPSPTSGTPASPATTAGAPGSTTSPATSSSATAAAPALTTTDSPGANTAALGAAPVANGQEVYTKTCSVCHAAGVTGAPKPGDKADWGPRIAQGNQVLYEHALKGFTGKKGMMPPKGGNTALADADVKAAVDFMVSQSR
jgi:cytochrome c5